MRADITSLLQQAVAAIDSNRPDDAERFGREVLKEKPGHADATKAVGYALLMQGKPKDAAAFLEKAARSSRDPEIETQLANAFAQAGDKDKALLWLKRAVKRTPPYLPAYLSFGQALQALKRFEEAIAILLEGRAAAPMMVELSIELAFAYQAKDDRAAAREAFGRALDISPGHPAALEGLSTLLMSGGGFKEAAEFLRRAIMANPDDAMARIQLGRCLLETKDSETAFACFRAVAERAPDAYGDVVKAVVASGRGRFWLRPSAAREFLKNEG